MNMEISDDAKRLLTLRYCRGNEKYSDVYPRVANALGKHNGNEKDFLIIMDENRFLPNSPALMNAGFSNMNKACFVLPIEDTMNGIFKTVKDAAMIFKFGGGCGYSFSELRQKDAPLSGGGTSSGVMSFIQIYDSITNAIKQGGRRRGASMGVLDIDHPEILDFIKAKLVPGNLENFNLSVMVTDDFMEKVTADELVYLRDRLDRRRTVGKFKAKDLFDLITFSSFLSGDPGMLFFDRINQDNPFREQIKACNPCGEQFLLPYESCCLGSVNLNSHVVDNDLDFNLLKDTIKIGTKFLLSINKYSEYPVDECYKAAYKTNRIGLGLMGLSDALMNMHILYDSDETLKLIDKIGELMLREAKKIAITSTSVLSIAPTGSISILAGCSNGIEPIYSADYERRVVAGTFRESRKTNEYLRTAHEISPEWHLKIQAKFQEYVDSAVSKTVNLPYDASIQDIRDVYYKAWKMKCKGITCYRDRSKDTQVYYATPKCDEDQCYL